MKYSTNMMRSGGFNDSNQESRVEKSGSITRKKLLPLVSQTKFGTITAQRNSPLKESYSTYDNTQ